MSKLAHRISLLKQEGAFAVLQKARQLEAQGRNIVHLEIGEPDFETPAHVAAAGQEAISAGWTHYGPTPGYEDFRAALASHVAATRAIAVEPTQVCVTPGGKPVIFFPILALVEPGDEVIYPNPGFPIYESMIRFAGGTPIAAPLIEERSFSFDLDRFRQSLSDKTKLVILNSPANPTGGVIPPDDLHEIARLCIERDVVVLSDEIYSRIWYGEAPLSIASLPGMAERTIILDGFSKTYAMTGWRLGYGVMPQWIADAVNKLMVNSNSCTASFTQRAGLAAITGPQDDVAHMLEQFTARRARFCAALNELPGFHCRMPDGAFYAFPNISGTGIASDELAERLLNEAGVACLSGKAFGELGESYLRFSYASSQENLDEAIRRMQSWLAQRR
jgi:aspartate aminotransferase